MEGRKVEERSLSQIQRNDVYEQVDIPASSDAKSKQIALQSHMVDNEIYETSSSPHEHSSALLQVNSIYESADYDIVAQGGATHNGTTTQINAPETNFDRRIHEQEGIDQPEMEINNIYESADSPGAIDETGNDYDYAYITVASVAAQMKK